MALRPTPIVVLSSRANRNQMQTAFEAHAARRPGGAAQARGHGELAAARREPAGDGAGAGRRAVARRTGGPRRPRPSWQDRRGHGHRRSRDRPGRDRGVLPQLLATGCAGWRSAPRPAGRRRSASFLDEIPADAPVELPDRPAHRLRLRAGLRRLAQQGAPPGRAAGAGRRAARAGAPCGWRRAAPTCCWRRGGVLRLDADTPPRRGHRPSADELFLVLRRGLPARGRRGAADRHGIGRRRGPARPAPGGRPHPGAGRGQLGRSSACRGWPWRRGAAEVALPPRDLARALVRLWTKGGAVNRPRPGGGRQRGHPGHPRPHPARRRLRGARGARRRRGRGAALRELPAVVVTDLEMPTMDGFPLLRLLKAEPASRRTCRC